MYCGAVKNFALTILFILSFCRVAPPAHRVHRVSLPRSVGRGRVVAATAVLPAVRPMRTRPTTANSSRLKTLKGRPTMAARKANLGKATAALAWAGQAARVRPSSTTKAGKRSFGNPERYFAFAPHFSVSHFSLLVLNPVHLHVSVNLITFFIRYFTLISTLHFANVGLQLSLERQLISRRLKAQT